MQRSSTAFVLGIATAAAAVVLYGGVRGTSRPALAATAPATTRGVVVDGVGRTSGTPDVLRVSLGVSVQRGDVSSALTAADACQTRLREALRRQGVAAGDIQTSDVSASPTYDNRGRTDGYQVTESLVAKLRDLKRAGKVITDAVAAGGREAVLQGVSFSLEDNTALLVKARDAAFADALAKAQRYAQLAGRSLGDVQLVTETSTPAQPVDARGYPSAAGAAGLALQVPIDPGTADVSVSVTVRWALR